jgi:hypothetical protein
VAKKVRTPPPPRRVQAPQRRDPKRRDGRAGAPSPRGIPLTWVGAGAAVALIAIGVLLFFLLRGNDNGASPPKINYNALPGIRKTKAPWPPDYAFLADRLAPLGLNTLAQEGVATHIHAHLDIFVDGKRVLVPAAIGINQGAGYITELHTHDTRGVIHVESPKKDDKFTLGQFVSEWGVFLNARCIGAYCDTLKWYVNGVRQTGDPEDLVLESHQEIAIVVGKPPKKIPSSYKFARGE